MPSSITLTRGDDTLTVAWPAANNATSYSVFLLDNSDNKWEDKWKEGVLFTEETSVTFDANNYLDYKASVRSHNGTGDSYSRDSAWSAATDTLLPPSYVAVTRGDGTLSASWAPADGATSYHVGWSDNNGATWHRERTSYVGTTIDFTVPKVDNNKSYAVNVMSTIGDVQSVWRYSDFVPPYTTGTPARPAAVTVTRSNGALNVSWNAVNNASTYHITYSSDNKQSWTLAAFGHNGTSITIDDVDNAKTYVVGVRGVNSQGNGGLWRNSAPAGPFMVVDSPAAPTNLAVAPGNGFLGITWDASALATGYDVRVKAQGASSWTTVASDISETSYNYVTTLTIDHVGVRARNSGGTSDWANVSRLPSSEMLNTHVSNGFMMAMASGLSESQDASAQSNQVSGQSQLTAPTWGTIKRTVNRQRGEIDLNWTHTGWATGFNLVCSDTDGWTWNVCGWDDDGTVTYTSVPTAESRPVTVTHYRRGSDSRHTPGDYDLTRTRHYTVAVRAVNANPSQASDWVNTQIIRPIFPYLRNFTYTRTDGQITMSWDPNPWTTGYNIYCDNYTSGGTYSPSYTQCATLTNQSHTDSRHSVTITHWTSGGTSYNINNTSTLDIKFKSTNATGEAEWLAPLISAGKTLSVSSVTATGATLTVHGHNATWWYKGRVRLGTYGTCTQVTGNVRKNLTTLTASTAYEYHAYSASGCADANLIATAEFRTIAAGSNPTLGLTNVTQTTARVTLSNRTGNWWYNYGTRQAGAGPCTAAQSGGTNNYVINLSQLTAGTSYQFTAYSDSTCTTQITLVQFSTSAGPALTATSITKKSATLNLANHSGDWWYQGGHRGGTLSACTKATGTTADLTGLSPNRSHTYGAFSASTCASAVQLDSVDFNTLSGPILTSGSILDTTAGLTISNHTGDWWYKQGSAGTCTKATGTTVSLTNLTASTSYTYTAYSANTCASGVLLDTVTFTTAAPVVALTVTNLQDTTATLNLANHTGNWWYQGGDRGGSLSACTAGSGTSADLTALTANTAYTYGAFSANTCATGVELDSVTFLTLATLTASNLGATTARLTIAGHTAQWWYKADVGPHTTCQGPVAANTATKDLTGLTTGTAYNYKAYSATGCADADLLSTTATFTTT